MSYKEIYHDIEKVFDRVGVQKNEKLIILLVDYVGEKVFSEKQELLDRFIERMEGVWDGKERKEG